MAALHVYVLLLISLAVDAEAQSSTTTDAYKQAYGSYRFYNQNNIPLTILNFCAANLHNCQAPSYTNFCGSYETTCSYLSSGATTHGNYISILLGRYCSVWCGLCSSNYLTTCKSKPQLKKCEYSRQEAIRSRIFGGQPASQCENPWTVKIDVENSNDHSKFCQGVLIDKQTVATTMECKLLLDNLSTSDTYLITVGEYVSNVYEPAVDVKLGVLSNIDYSNGIAKFSVYPPVSEYSYCVAPACLPSSDNTIRVDRTKCKMTGWGLTSSGSPGLPFTTLKTADVVIAEESECFSILSLLTSLPVSGISIYPSDPRLTGCVSLAKTWASACSGDEGGAVTCKETTTGEQILVGLVKTGACEPLSATLFANITTIL